MLHNVRCHHSHLFFNKTKQQLHDCHFEAVIFLKKMKTKNL